MIRTRPVSARRWRPILAAAAIALSATGAAAEIRFQARTDRDVGAGAAAFTLVGGGDLLVVSTAKGLVALRREDGQLVQSARWPGGAGAEVLAGGPFGAGGAMQLAFGGRDAAQITVAAVDGRGALGGAREIALPGPPRAARVAPLRRGDAAAALFVATDGGLSVLSWRDGGWQRQEVAIPGQITDFAVGDLTGDGRADLLVADDGRDQLRLLRGRGDGRFEPGASAASVRGLRRVILADATGDGRLDPIVLGEAGLAHHAALEGGFGPPQVTWATPHLSDVAAADVTGDGRVDLLAVDRNRAVLSVFAGTAAGSFAAGESYLVGGGPSALQLGDVDGDGTLDALTLNRLGDSTTLLRGRGDGRFDGVRCLLGSLGGMNAVVVDDFDLDGRPDLAVAGEDGGEIALFLGRGDGGFRQLPPVAVGRQPRALATGDFNQDERPDLAVVIFGGDAVAILDGDGRGGFAPPRPIAVGTGPSAIGIGSFASDTSTDLAVVNSLSNSVSVLYGDGRGAFPTIASFPVELRPSFLMVGDTNRDGHQDLVVGGELTESVAVLLGTGERLDAPTTRTLSAAARPSLAEDLDGDGAMDLINPDRVRGVIEILPGAEAGSFGTPLRVEVGRDPHAVGAGDFDRDGRIDLVVVHRATQLIAVVLNRSPAAERRARHGQRAAGRATPAAAEPARRG